MRTKPLVFYGYIHCLFFLMTLFIDKFNTELDWTEEFVAQFDMSVGAEGGLSTRVPESG